MSDAEATPGVIIERSDQDNTVVFTFTNGSLQVTIRQGDISTEPCDAIINPTSESMNPTGGLDEIIHKRMGAFYSDQVTAIRNRAKEQACPVGQSRIFLSKFDRDPNTAHYVINTVGPVYSAEEPEQAAFHLQSCYHTSLQIANLYGVTSIAYPAISCGTFRFPLADAARVGIKAIRNYSNQVKDVRFILLDKPVYDAFVHEWTAYCEKINEEASAINNRHCFRLPSESGQKRCLLCKAEYTSSLDLPLCDSCSKLSRLEYFVRFLQQLRCAAERSFSDLQGECRTLQTLLAQHPLTYTPVEKFVPNIHQRDAVAEFFFRNKCDSVFRTNTMPISIVGDGNCFYNTFVKVSGTGATADVSSISPVELRTRNIVELVLHQSDYTEKHPTLVSILDSFQEYVTKEMVRDGNYVAVWDFLSIPTVLNVNVISVYPYVNGQSDQFYKILNGYSYTPLPSAHPASSTDVKILFSNCNKPPQFGPNVERGWLPNHYVPLLKIQ